MPCVKIKLVQFADGEVTGQQIIDAAIADPGITVNGELFFRQVAADKGLICFAVGVLDKTSRKNLQELILKNPLTPIAVDFPKEDTEDFETYPLATDFTGTTRTMKDSNISLKYTDAFGSNKSKLEVADQSGGFLEGTQSLRLQQGSGSVVVPSGTLFIHHAQVNVDPVFSLMGLSIVREYEVELDLKIVDTVDGVAAVHGVSNFCYRMNSN